MTQRMDVARKALATLADELMTNPWRLVSRWPSPSTSTTAVEVDMADVELAPAGADDLIEVGAWRWSARRAVGVSSRGEPLKRDGAGSASQVSGGDNDEE